MNECTRPTRPNFLIFFLNLTFELPSIPRTSFQFHVILENTANTLKHVLHNLQLSKN